MQSKPALLINPDYDCARVGEYYYVSRRYYTLNSLGDAVVYGKFPIIRKHTRSICGVSKEPRFMCECQFTIDGQQLEGLVDLVTGSVYHNGICQSGNLSIVE